MPVEIRELVIRATIDSRGKEGGSGGNGQASPQQKKEIVEECVEQVLEILRQKGER
ncbi:MAG TPA: DUF5908 family protein [Rhodothermales bacterium]|nr:DUF5908 family protein [Rhodothermales bacterium]